jgi:hypothetical protein
MSCNIVIRPVLNQIDVVDAELILSQVIAICPGNI